MGGLKSMFSMARAGTTGRSRAHVVAAVLVMVLFIVSGCSGDPEPLHPASREVLLRVDGEDITEQELAIMARSFEANVQAMKLAVEARSPSSGIFRRDISNHDYYGPTIVATGELVRVAALFSAARALGLVPDEAIVAEMIEGHRGAVESGAIAYLEQLVSEVGEEIYWGEFAPKAMERQALLLELERYGRDGISIADGAPVDVDDFRRDVLSTAEVELVGEHPLITQATIDWAKVFVEQSYIGGATATPTAQLDGTQ